VNGEVLLAGGGWFARAVIGMTHGWHGPLDRPVTEGELLDHWNDIMKDDDIILPASALELGQFLPKDE
jgi:hypothetical protein